MLIALTVSVFLLTILILQLLVRSLTFAQRRVELRWAEAIGQSQPSAAVTPVKRRRSGRRTWSLTLPNSLIGKQYLDKLQEELSRAEVPLKAGEFVTIMLMSGLFSFALGMLILGAMAAGLLFGVVGGYLPLGWVKLLKSRRLAKFEGQLLDGAVLLANSLRAGHSFLQALELVSREGSQPLAGEFSRVIRETKLGMGVEEALGNMVRRVQSKDLDLLITGVLIQRQVGGNLAEILDGIADTIDKRIKMKARIRVLTAQGRMSAWIVSLLPFALGAFVFGKYPQFATIMLTEPVGRIMMISGLFMLVIGILVIRKVVSIDV